MASLANAPRSYSIFDAKAKLSEILDQVSEGEEIIITRRGKPVAKLVSIPQTGKRRLGFAAGEVGFLPGWDEPLFGKAAKQGIEDVSNGI